MRTVDVVIPTYQPGQKLLQLLDQLSKQTVPVNKIILMNTEEKYFDRFIYGTAFNEKYKNVVVYHCSKKEFDHGNTRNRAVKHSSSDFVVMMTQDAVPKDSFLLEKLLKPLLEYDDVVVSYARQLPNADCRAIESYTRSFNYPEKSCIKSWGDLDRLGIKTFFCSNVCAAYKREAFLELGGFVKHTIFNEDMIFAATAMKAGKRVAYAADALVVHSHNYTAGQQLKRNFDLGVSQADHPEVFSVVRSESEGLKLVRRTAAFLREKHLVGQIPVLYVHSACKYIGYRLGRHYKKLPKRLILKLTSNPDYWRQYQMKKDVSSIDATKGYGRNLEKER
ncbi:MAG: glycosyltransferase family 2 protein [Lachnospiraceae bacterium]|nr:glycosyltransferase family 2 protein [Lachnospiraceae bacterium]